MGVGLVGPMSTVYMLCPMHADSLYTHTLDLKWTHGSMCHEDRTHQRHLLCSVHSTSCFHSDLRPSPQELGMELGGAREEEL